VVGGNAAVLDVEFLLEKPSFAGTMIYLYRTGALRPRIKEHLRQRAEQQGKILSSVTPGDDLLPSAAVFPSFGICDWGDIGRRRRGSNPFQIAAAFPDENVAHFVPAQAYANGKDRHICADRCLTIEEPEINRSTIIQVLRYLERTTDLRPSESLLGRRGYLRSFEELVQERSTFVDVMKKFDVLTLTCTDAESGEFKPDTVEGDNKGTRGRTSLQKKTEAFLVNRDVKGLVELVQHAAFLHSMRGWTAARLMRSFYDASQATLARWTKGRNATEAERRRQYAAHGLDVEAMLRHHIVWTALLFAWEPRLLAEDRRRSLSYRPCPPVLVSRLHLLLSDYLERTSPRYEGDPLAELWSDIDAATLKLAQAANGALDRARQRSAVSFAAEAGRNGRPGLSWLVRVHQRFQSALTEAERALGAEGIDD
jgi:hypothetical protein